MKTMIVTGSNSGIGKEAALILAKSGHRILMLCRNSEKSRQAQQAIRTQSGNEQVYLIPVDLADRASIYAAVEQIKAQFPEIDVLINNAGLYKVKRAETADGIELSLAVNFLGPYVLSQLLLDNLEASGNGRIVNVSSELYKNGTIDFDNLMMKTGYKVGSAYANSKLAAILYTAELAKRTQAKGITVNALHPGVLATNAFREYPGFVVKFLNLFLEKPHKGGERIAYLAASADVAGVTGKYFYKTEERAVDIAAEEQGKTEKLMQVAQDLTAIAL